LEIKQLLKAVMVFIFQDAIIAGIPQSIQMHLFINLGQHGHQFPTKMENILFYPIRKVFSKVQ
jgi:hypothetical protein